MNDLVFIDYLSRSGSTVICTELHKVRDLNVTPEFRMGIFRDPLVESAAIKTNPNHWQELLAYSKNKRLILHAEEKHKSINSHFDAIEKLLDMAGLLNQDGAVCVKGGGYYTIHWEKYLESNKEYRLIYIYRDPRAVYSSQKRSLDSIRMKPMKTNLIRYVHEVLVYNKCSRRKAYDNSVFRIKFEDFVANRDIIIKQICDWLNIDFIKEQSSDYFEIINLKERHLHANIKKPLRNDYNKLVLSSLEHFALNSFLYRYLRHENYPVKRIYAFTHILLKPVIWIYSFMYTRIS